MTLFNFKFKRPPYLNSSVIILSIVSLCNDFSSEMLYPILSIYMTQLGMVPAAIGLIEGIAECVAAILKLLSGAWSDASGKRKSFIVGGYALSGISKGVLALATTWLGVFIARSMDRFGKGVRTPARDAMLADNCKPENRAAVFGFHKSADTIGAIIGPIATIILLHYAISMRNIFLLAMIPSALSLIALYYLPSQKILKPTTAFSFKDTLSFYKTANTKYKNLFWVFALFALFNTSDVFLILKLKENGVSTQTCLYYYLLFNIVFTISAYPIGILADKIKKNYLMIAGLLVYAVVYAILAFGKNNIAYIIAFLLYGFFYALTDGVSKALITNNCTAEDKAKALALFSSMQSICFLIAGVVLGSIWYLDAGTTTLLCGSIMALVAAILLYVLSRKQIMNDR